MRDYLKGLAHIGIYTENIETSKEFYIKKLGFQLMFDTIVEKPNNEWLKISMLTLNGLNIELLEPSNKKRVYLGNMGSFDHFAIEVNNLNEVVEDLRQQGIEFEMDNPRQVSQLFNGISIIFFRGPSGERIELFEYIK